MTTTTRQPAKRSGPHRAIDPAARPIDRRTWAYRVVAFLVVVLILTGPGGAVGLLAPWTAVGPADASFELHRWHSTDIAVFASLLVAGPLLASLRRPRASVALVQSALVGAVSLAALAPLMPAPAAALVPAGAITGLVLASFPDRRSLLRLPASGGPWSSRLAALAAAPFLLWNAAQNLQWQLSGAGPHAELGHWAGAVALALTLLVAGRLAASPGHDARRLSIVVGASYAYIGAAALQLPVHDGSWGTGGGLLSLALAVLFLLPSSRRIGPEVAR